MTTFLVWILGCKIQNFHIFNCYAIIYENALRSKTGKELHSSRLSQKAADHITEGETFHHCVGRMGYDQRFAEEKSIIIFIRSALNPQTSLVTVEYWPEKHKILQCHENNNTAPQEEVREYIYKKWLPYANRKIKK